MPLLVHVLITTSYCQQVRACTVSYQESLLRSCVLHRIYCSQIPCCAPARGTGSTAAKISVAQPRAARTRGAARITHSAGRPGTRRSSPQDLHLTHNNNTLKLPSHSRYLTALFIVLYYLGL